MSRTILAISVASWIALSSPGASAEEHPFSSSTQFYVDPNAQANQYDSRHWGDVCRQFFPDSKNLMKRVTTHAQGVWFTGDNGGRSKASELVAMLGTLYRSSSLTIFRTEMLGATRRVGPVAGGNIIFGSRALLKESAITKPWSSWSPMRSCS